MSLIRAARASPTSGATQHDRTMKNSVTRYRMDRFPFLKWPDHIYDPAKPSWTLFFCQHAMSGVFDPGIGNQIRTYAIIWPNIFWADYATQDDILAFIVDNNLFLAFDIEVAIGKDFSHYRGDGGEQRILAAGGSRAVKAVGQVGFYYR